MGKNPEIYKARIFRELGFERKVGEVCGAFWTLNKEVEDCGEGEYTFLLNPPKSVGVESVDDVREKFLRFFEKVGHTRVKRYPVVARWRDDVYLVGASIYVFQPWVTNGIVPPPANPLVISQPSIRLTDVDNVGRSGRHLTSFEMMAHHAFTIPSLGVKSYWVDETVEYAFEFFTKELGIPEDEIFFKEDWWEGGGNAGECFEVIIRGLEVATLVFMHYKEVDGKYEEMPNRIVDTGYGLERIYWLLSGKPTVYDAVYGDFIEKLRQKLGFEPVDEKLLAEIVRHAGKFDLKEIPLSKFREEVAKRVGLSVDELRRIMEPRELLYITADHMRSVMLMLADGVVPSNSGAGYLARLLIRRVLRLLYSHGIEMGLDEIAKMLAPYLKSIVPDLDEVLPTILEMLQVEERKYRELLSSAPAIVLKLLKARKGKLSLDDLILLYDSHGIPPEIVTQIAEKHGFKVTYPDNFYSILAERHQKASKVRETRARLEDIFGKYVEGLPETRTLFYEDQYMREFTAKVLKVFEVKGERYVVLDATAFYPEGGGQPYDTGYLEFEGGKARVTAVYKVFNVIVHRVEGAVPREGEVVKGVIDWERRNRLMRAHTATHIVLAAARKVLGRHVWQAGAQKGEFESRLDITHYKHLGKEDIRKIEEVANAIVLASIPVKTFFMDRDKAEAKYGVILYQGGVVPSKTLRIVEIEGVDAEACGGTHVRNTAEVGLIKIVRAERIQDGVERLVFTYGPSALKYLYTLEDSLEKVAKAIGSQPSPEAVSRAVDSYVAKVKEMERRLSRYRKFYMEHLLKELESTMSSIVNVKFGYLELEDEDEGLINELLRKATSESSRVVAVVNSVGKVKVVYLASSRDVKLHIGSLIKKVAQHVRGKGGGSKTYGRLVVPSDVDTRNVIEAIANTVLAEVSSGGE